MRNPSSVSYLKLTFLQAPSKMFASPPYGNHLTVNTTDAKTTRNKDAVRIFQLFINAFFGKFFAVNQSDIHMATIEDS